VGEIKILSPSVDNLGIWETASWNGREIHDKEHELINELTERKIDVSLRNEEEGARDLNGGLILWR